MNGGKPLCDPPGSAHSLGSRSPRDAPHIESQSRPPLPRGRSPLTVESRNDTETRIFLSAVTHLAMIHRRIAHWIGLGCLLTGVGCAAAVPYRYGHFHSDESADTPTELAGAEVEFGKPNPTLDRIARVVGLPARIIGLNKKINNHEVSLDTLAALRTYLDANDLADVSIYVNCYDPKQQWRRLKNNQRIGAGWRYSLGTLSMIGYTLLPGRVFGGDQYNPYTNSLSINSDVPAIALYEAAYAKDVHGHKLPGTYAVLSGLPGIAIVRRGHEVGDVLGYAQARHDWETERQAYHVLYPQMGAETASIAGPVMPVWWAMPILGVGGAAAGHVTGRMVAAHRASQIGAALEPEVPAKTDQAPDDVPDKAAPGPPAGVEPSIPAGSP